MSIGDKLEAEWDAARAELARMTGHGRHLPVAVPAIPTQENHMTTPQQPRLVDSLHAITAEFANNKLIARLADHRLGALLTDEQADHFCALIDSVERAKVLTYAEPQQQHDGAQQQAQ
jgi:hypothetical protein